ncbi:MAG: response regulator transcription factor [Chloroflexi bacterium]|nr:response regulator transcription factor [Chloroflexota bacterium]
MILILVVDDDLDVAKTISMNLASQGYQVVVANNGYEALQRIHRQHPDLILLDMAMPEMDGIEVCQRVRANPTTAAIPILFLTARSGIESKIVGFNAGADDYLVKPFNLQELELRVKALLRRTSKQTESPQTLTVGTLTLNVRTFEMTNASRKALLTPVEFELLYFLMTHAGEVFTSGDLLRHVWRYPPDAGSPELVRVHIKNLRNKIEAAPHAPVYLKTIGRFGYSIQIDEPPNAALPSERP